VWKKHDFSITHILREIKLGDSRSAKSAILAHLVALNFDFCDLFALFWRLKLTKLTKFRAPKMTKIAVLEVISSPKLISREI